MMNPAPLSVTGNQTVPQGIISDDVLRKVLDEYPTLRANILEEAYYPLLDLKTLPQEQIDDIVLKTGKLLADNFPSNAAFTAHTARGKIRKMLVRDIKMGITTEVFDELVARTVQVPPIYGIVSLPPLKRGGKMRYRVNPGNTDRRHNTIKNDTMSSVIETIQEKSCYRVSTVEEIVVEGHQSQMVRTSIDVLLALGVVEVIEVSHRIKFRWNAPQAEAVKQAPETIIRYHKLCQEVEDLKNKISELKRTKGVAEETTDAFIG